VPAEQERNESAYYESDILLSDLLNSAQDDRIQLNLQQHHGTKPGSQQQEQNGSSKRKAGEEAVSELESAIQRRKIIREIQDVFDEAWEPRLESVSNKHRRRRGAPFILQLVRRTLRLIDVSFLRTCAPGRCAV
jgi:hypothetical protein